MLIKHTALEYIYICVCVFGQTVQMQHNLSCFYHLYFLTARQVVCVCGGGGVHVCQGVPTSGIYSWGKSDISGVTMDTVATELQYLWVGGLKCGCACTSASYTSSTPTPTHAGETLNHSQFLPFFFPHQKYNRTLSFSFLARISTVHNESLVWLVTLQQQQWQWNYQPYLLSHFVAHLELPLFSLCHPKPSLPVTSSPPRLPLWQRPPIRICQSASQLLLFSFWLSCVQTPSPFIHGSDQTFCEWYLPCYST